MVIIIDYFGARNELGTELPEAVETRASLIFFIEPMACPTCFGVYFTMLIFTRDLLWFDQVETLNRFLGVWYRIIKIDC